MDQPAYKCSILIVDDEEFVRLTLARQLGREFEVLCADSAEAARAILGQREVDIILADQQLPGQSGTQFLDWVRQHQPRSVRLMMTGLARFEDAVEAINCGQVSRFLFKPWHAEELLQILRDAAKTLLLERSHEELLEQLRVLNTQLEERVRERTRQLQEANHQLQQKNWMLEKLALTDTLTGLPNRRAMDRLVLAELRRRTRYPCPLALCIIDADHFKDVNARYLLTGGDQVLIGLAKTLVHSVRTVDSTGRIGGEEFAVLAPETNLEGAEVLTERMRSAVEESSVMYNGEEIRVTVSVGCAVVDTDIPVNYEVLKHTAAAALQEAKRTGRNRSVIHNITKPLEQVG
ncbi:MAG: diguanylate cyclase [Gemmataceae bacterium]